MSLRHPPSLRLPLSILFVSLLASASPPDLAAQPAAPSDPINSLTGGSQALQFQIQPQFQVSDFQGGVLSGKRQLSPSRAVRVGVGFSLLDNSYEGNVRTFFGDSVQADTMDQEERMLSLKLVAQYLRYVSPASRGSFFYGAGPMVTFSRAELTRGADDPPVVMEMERSTGFAGLSAVAGIEWFASREISLHAEYGLAAGYTWSESDDLNRISYSPPRMNSRKLDESGWSWGPRSVLFGCSLYF